MMNEMSDFSFERDRRMDGQTERLIEVLWRIWHLEPFPVIFASFRDFQLERDRPTDQPTNRPIERPTDRASYRGVMAHLKKIKE